MCRVNSRCRGRSSGQEDLEMDELLAALMLCPPDLALVPLLFRLDAVVDLEHARLLPRLLVMLIVGLRLEVREPVLDDLVQHLPLLFLQLGHLKRRSRYLLLRGKQMLWTVCNRC